MPIVGHGIDLVEVDRISQMIARHGDHFLLRVFTEAERGYAHASAKRRDEHLAARFAAKEAALKALGTGWRSGIAWTDIEVVRDASGKPVLNVTGEALRIAESISITRWHVSLSHTESHAIASVIATTEPHTPGESPTTGARP
jgi:holo-[acyl-carrier protein] synthase